MRIIIRISIVMCLVLPVCFPGSVPAAEKIKLRFNYTMPSKAPPSDAWEWWGEELNRQTNGKVDVEYYPLSALFSPNAAVENIIKGTADITNISIRTTALRYPLLSVTMVPTVLWPNNPQGIKDASTAIMKLIDEFPSIQKEVSRFKVLWILMPI